MTSLPPRSSASIPLPMLPPPPDRGPIGLPPAAFQDAAGQWAAHHPEVREGLTGFGGESRVAAMATGDWNSVKAVWTAPEHWNAGFSPELTYANFVEARVDLHHAGSLGLDLELMGVKRGLVLTGAGDDHVTWSAHSNRGGPPENTMTISTGAGADTIQVAPVAQTAADDGMTQGALWNAAYDGRHSIASVRSGEGADVIVAEGMVTLRAFGGAGADTITGGAEADYIRGGRGDDLMTGGAGADLFLFRDGAGQDRVTDFVVGSDHLRILGAQDAVTSAVAVVDGVAGLLVRYGDDSVFLEGVTAPVSTDELLG